MPDRFGSAKANNKAPTTSVLGGLKNRSPKAQDASTKPNSPMGGGVKSVNADATRSSVARTPRSLGPRVA
jgi:hypothetical protein